VDYIRNESFYRKYRIRLVQNMTSRIAIALFLILGVLPLCGGLLYALAYSTGGIGALSEGWSLHAWQVLLSDTSLWRSLALSAAIALGVVILAVASALGILLLLRPQLEQPMMRRALHLPLVLPPMVAAMLSFQWLGNSGMLARVAVATGWIADAQSFPALINDPGYIGVVLTLTLMTFPILLLILQSHYKQANLGQMSQLAATLGASDRAAAWRVVVPILLRRIQPVVLLYWVLLFGVFEVPLLLGRQNPAMISMFIHQKFNRFNVADLPVAYAATVVYALLVMGVLAAVKNRQ
jgi:putative spermidine/putrescine transport system permease protein